MKKFYFRDFVIIISILSSIILFSFLYSIIFFIASWNIFSYAAENSYSAENIFYNKKGDRLDILTGSEKFVINNYYDNEIILRKRNHIYSMPILKFYSRYFALGVRWRRDDLLEIQVEASSDLKISRMIQNMGPIHIKYYFIKRGESVPAPDIRSRVATCPPPYASPFWRCIQGFPGLQVE